MTEEKRKKTSQLNFRLPPELSDRFGSYCEKRGLSKQQFFENAVRQALGEPIAVPPDVFGVAIHNKATVPDARLDKIEARLEGVEEVKGAIAPLQRQLDELRTELEKSQGERAA